MHHGTVQLYFDEECRLHRSMWHGSLSSAACLDVPVHVCARARARACVRACVCACMWVGMCVWARCMHACMPKQRGIDGAIDRVDGGIEGIDSIDDCADGIERGSSARCARYAASKDTGRDVIRGSVAVRL